MNNLKQSIIIVVEYNLRILVNVEIIASAVVQTIVVDAAGFAPIYCVDRGVPRFIELRL